MKWEDRTFNVDSFQGMFYTRIFDAASLNVIDDLGNEEDHIILSVVRSNKPGFLKNERRMNVMLSRCKKSMIVCSSRSFLAKPEIAATLVGKLAAEWAGMSANAWISSKQILKEKW